MQQYPYITQKNHIFCKDISKATSFNSRILKDASNAEALRISKAQSEYLNHAARKSMTSKEDDFQDVLIAEMELLKKIIDENQNSLKDLTSRNHLRKEKAMNSKIENKLMRLSELDRERHLMHLNKKKIDILEDTYREKCSVLNSTTSRLRQNYSELQTEISNKNEEIDLMEMERFRLLSEIDMLKQRNDELRAEAESARKITLEEDLKHPNSHIIKLSKCKSSKTICKSTIPKIRISGKDSLIASPLSNASLPTVTQFSKRRESNDKDNSRILRGLPTTKKGKSSLIKSRNLKK